MMINNMDGSCKISIVTIVFNDKDNIADTIKSCVNQTYSNTELIVVDGGSTDGTVEIINSYKLKIQVVISEKDKGIYDAMNKGVEKATGDWIIFMNSGDQFYDNNVISKVYQNGCDGDVIYGKNQSVYPYFTRINSPFPISKLKYGMIFSHQSMFVRSQLMKQNLYNLNYKISADFNFIYKLFKEGKQFKEVDIVISKVLAGGASEVNLIKTHLERKKIALEYEKGFNKTTLSLHYSLISLKIRVVSFIKAILPKVIIRVLTKIKYGKL